MMEWILFLAAAVAALVVFIKLIGWASAQDTEARGHERIRSKRERSRLSAMFDDIVSDIRKKP